MKFVCSDPRRYPAQPCCDGSTPCAVLRSSRDFMAVHVWRVRKDAASRSAVGAAMTEIRALLQRSRRVARRWPASHGRRRRRGRAAAEAPAETKPEAEAPARGPGGPAEPAKTRADRRVGASPESARTFQRRPPRWLWRRRGAAVRGRGCRGSMPPDRAKDRRAHGQTSGGHTSGADLVKSDSITQTPPRPRQGHTWRTSGVEFAAILGECGAALFSALVRRPLLGPRLQQDANPSRRRGLPRPARLLPMFHR